MIILPTGTDLLSTLQYAYSGKSYALYGDEVDVILAVPDVSEIEIPPANTLIWVGDDPPTKEDIATAWTNYQKYKKPDPERFQSQVYEDMDLRPALLRVNPIAFTMLIRLLDAKDESFSIENIQGAIDAVRGSMNPDFSSTQLSRLSGYAKDNGLNLRFE